MKYTPSINIENSLFDDSRYIVTGNAKCVVGNIIDSYNAGLHTFNIIGSYGTGKSSFILALESALQGKGSDLIVNNGQFDGLKKIRFVKLVGEYTSFANLISQKLFVGYNSQNIFENLEYMYNEAKANGEFIFLIVDEFGKILEYAAKNNPERELYFIQQLAEFVNNSKHKTALITTLHQNFNAYSKGLSDSQKNEWIKVKGRFKEIVFNEPVEQLLYLASQHIDRSREKLINNNFEKLYKLAIDSKYSSSSISYDTAAKLYPIDLFAAQTLTLAIQKYGQNERTLFSFLEAKDQYSLNSYIEGKNKTYNMADVYDYSLYNFYSYLSEVNIDSPNWASIRVSLERAEGLWEDEMVISASKIIKTIGLFNLFGSAGASISKEALSFYSKHALNIANPESVIDLLVQHKIIRFASYKSQYVLFEGTDVNIEDEVLKAASIVPRSRDFVEKLKSSFQFPIEFATSAYYKKGTPRYFEYNITQDPILPKFEQEIDGCINLVFSKSEDILDNIKETSLQAKDAIIYAYFNNTESIIDHMWQIDKFEYVLSLIDTADKVACREIKSLISYEKELLNNSVFAALFELGPEVTWIYNGEVVVIKSRAEFNKMLSRICDDVYNSTPTFINEMVNKQKPSSAMSVARVNYLTALLQSSDLPNLGFPDDKFPPEKTLYLTLLRNTNIHRQVFGSWELLAPTEPSFMPLWDACEVFFNDSIEKPKKLGELIKILKSKPIKLKQGLIDIWIPTYLIIKQNDYSLYDSNGTYIPSLNKEVLDILQKSPNDFTIKAFNVDGVKLNLFNKYREAINLDQEDFVSTGNLIETIRPFIVFYNKLNKYAKQTNKLGSSTIKFRNVLAYAKDPEKTFFEDLPRALGFKDTVLADNEDVLRRYVELLQKAIRDLRSCYVGLIDRLERSLLDALHLKSSNYAEYKTEIDERYNAIKVNLLTAKQKTFITRVLSPSNDRQVWYQSLAFVILDKQLDNILDEEEEYLIDNLIYSFNELSRYIDLSKCDLNEDDNFIRFEMISNSGQLEPQIIRIDNANIKTAKTLEDQINSILSGNPELDLYALLNVVKSKIGHE